jgi:hypothetical protein
LHAATVIEETCVQRARIRFRAKSKQPVLAAKRTSRDGLRASPVTWFG